MSERRLPTATYRLQLHAGFGFADAAAVVPYLSRLGISHLYLSPILQAAPGSMHGYDVVDHTSVSRDLGGEPGLDDLAQTAHEHGLGIVLDVVPNHMAIPVPASLNQPLWETLRLGRDAPRAHWFDVDWDYGDDRIALPILGGSLEEVLAAGELTLDTQGAEPLLQYFDHRFPVAPGTVTEDAASTLSQQHYTLAGWREKSQLLNYRRFFDVDSLIAIRVELADVFDATHATLLDLHRRGVVDGFRIDHPDGLADPRAYLERLREATDASWVVVEKILAPGERLLPTWPAAGTTGYDAIRAVQGALVPDAGPDLDRRWQAVGGEPSYQRAELGSKRQVVADLFRAEVERLARAAVPAAEAAGRRLTRADARDALTELLAHVAVYRAYLRLDEPPSDESKQLLGELTDRARDARPDLAPTIDVVAGLLSDPTAPDASNRDLVVRFQQVCGPVMAKGVEDTAYYRWHRMVALNEVGGDPATIDADGANALHRWAQAQWSDHPTGMTTLSTHDTKRNEDARARLLAVAEDLDGWDAVTGAVLREAATSDVDPPTAYFVAQTLLGCWPITAERLDGYLEKAIREAKQHTTWSDPNPAYEARVLQLAHACLTGPVSALLTRISDRNAAGTRAVSLAAKLLQLTLPGVPDVYQGTELADPVLVDPDNRRSVDYDRRAGLLDRLEGLASPPSLADLDADKLWLTSRTLRLRRDRPELFDASARYVPLRSDSPCLLGFVRAHAMATVVTRWPGRLARSGWRGAVVDLPPGQWTDVLTGKTVSVGNARTRAADLLGDWPAALLVKVPA